MPGGGPLIAEGPEGGGPLYPGGPDIGEMRQDARYVLINAISVGCSTTQKQWC